MRDLQTKSAKCFMRYIFIQITSYFFFSIVLLLFFQPKRIKKLIVAYINFHNTQSNYCDGAETIFTGQDGPKIFLS